MFKKWSVAALAACLLAPLAVPPASAAAASAEGAEPAVRQQPYAWSRAAVVGGGYIPGIVYSEAEAGLAYARTDMGGAYRRDASTGGKWKQLLEGVGMEEWNLLGVESIAADPSDADRVYAALGTYTNDWTDMNGFMYRSSDRGETWQRTELPFKLGGNMPGRNMGERLSVDPNDGRVLFFGARSGNGLWKSSDAGATWARVASFTAVGQVADDYMKDPLGIAWVVFDKSSGQPGSPTPTLYAGTAERTSPIYRSTDAGETWQPVPGQPEQGFLPNRGVLSRDGRLYVSYAKDIGPYNGGEGSLWALDTKSGDWTDISPEGPGSTSSPYGGLAVDAQNPDIVMAATLNKWWPDEQIYRSLDGGRSWTPFWTFGSYPERVNKYELDYSLSPWLDWGRKTDPLPETSPKLGWMIGDLKIDPFDSDSFLYGTGATMYGSDNATAMDRPVTVGGDVYEKVRISVKAEGIEETAVLGLVSPPSGAPLLSAMGDIGGFRHADLGRAPEMITNPYIGSSTDIDYAELDPNDVVRVGNVSGSDVGIGVSHDNGVTWQPGANPWGSGASVNGGFVAMAADGGSIVWGAEGQAVYRSTDDGATWTAAAGIPAGAIVASDRVDPDRFYGFADGVLYASEDGGATFAATGAEGLPRKITSKLKAVPGRAGEVWIAGGRDNKNPDDAFGLYRSTDAGATFERLDGIEEAVTIGFGKAAPGQDEPALYSYAKQGGQWGVYRSDDGGASWIRINDDAHQFGAANRAITGDPRVYGRVYMATNGLGIVVGEPSGEIEPLPGTSPDPQPSAEPSPSVSPDPQPSAGPTASPGTGGVPSPTSAPQPTPAPTPAPSASAAPTASAAPSASPSPSFIDLKETHWAAAAASGLARLGLVQGVPGGRFEPQRPMTRAEFAALLVRALRLPAAEPGASTFADVPAGAWYAAEVSAAASAGLAAGTGDGRFDPAAPIRRQDMAVLLERARQRLDAAGSSASPTAAAAEFRDREAIAAYARSSVQALAAAGILGGDAEGRLLPAKPATRAEAAVALWRLLQLVPQSR
ncbi:S-layer homology domain-containing protein [Paenibacillus sp. FSL W8-1187]|uniref:Putative secreted cellulase n=1 Tax=Paenibacillus pasadenensis TaxID=217090 RepID=A0A2N5NA26_9BACL|nr:MULTISPECIES: S-layer homology domain-containing protein [Paenibacillus]PLT47207.1 putative secreted cellulase [Paenibacillus pasadenensis]QGG57525.1 xyloglucanase [Paenibacillus sp. B01]